MKCGMTALFLAALMGAGCTTAQPAKTPEKVQPAPEVKSVKVQPAPEVKTVKVQSDSDAELLKTADPMFENILSALRKGDARAFLRDQIPENREKLSERDFPQVAAGFNSYYGKIKSRTLLGVVRKYKTCIVLWKGVFERTPLIEEKMRRGGIDPKTAPDTETLIMLTLVQRGGKWQVAGCPFL